MNDLVYFIMGCIVACVGWFVSMAYWNSQPRPYRRPRSMTFIFYKNGSVTVVDDRGEKWRAARFVRSERDVGGTVVWAIEWKEEEKKYE